MKVVFEYLGKNEAGPVFTYNMAKGFVENGAEVYAIIWREIDNLNDWISLLGPEKVFIFSNKPNSEQSKAGKAVAFLRFLRECRKLKDFFKGVQFNYSIRTFIGHFETYLDRFIAVSKTINVCHDPIPHSNWPKRKANWYIEQNKKASYIIVLTKAFIPIIRDNYGFDNNRIFWMRHGLLSYPILPTIADDSHINFLFFGRLDGYKGLGVLGEAYSRLSAKNKDVALTIAGSGDFEPYKVNYRDCPNLTVMNRYIADEEVPVLFSKPKTVLVLPYLDATQSGVMSLAYFYNIPVIAANTGGLKEQLFDGEVGILVEPNDSDALFLAMKRFVDDKGLWNNQSQIMEKAKEKLDWKTVTEPIVAKLSQAS